MQLQKPINQEPFTLYDDEGGQHFLKFTKVDLRNSECLRVWRTQFLASLMGARDLPQRCIHHESLASDALHFAWRDNLHLLRDDFRYLIASPGNPAWDIKTLTLIDITGAAHTLSFGKSAVLHTRVEKWRTQTINNTIKSFQRVFGRYISTPQPPFDIPAHELPAQGTRPVSIRRTPRFSSFRKCSGRTFTTMATATCPLTTTYDVSKCLRSQSLHRPVCDSR